MAGNLAGSLLKDLIKRYGIEKGMEVYLKMREEGKGPFAKGKKYQPKVKNK